MEQYELTSEGYIRIKQQIKDRLNETVNSFIAIGYYFKQVRDSDVYTQDGYSGINDFAKGEYGLDASTTSRFMAMNTAYSEDGNSLIIKAQYKAIAEARSGKSLLEEMLTMSDEDRELVTEDTTVRQVREIKALERKEAEVEKAQKEAELPLVAQGGLEASKSTIEHDVRLTENDIAVPQDEAEDAEPAEAAEETDDREDAVIVEDETEIAYEAGKCICAETINEAEERALRLRRYLTKDVDAARNFFMEELKRMERSGVGHTAKFQYYQMAYDAITKWFCD